MSERENKHLMQNIINVYLENAYDYWMLESIYF